MSTISEIMIKTHRRCDEWLSKTESLVAEENWEQGRTAFDQFRHAMKLHFSMEEDVLFPGLEKWKEQAVEPTKLMRMEHEQMRHVLVDMEEAVAREDRDLCLGSAEALLVVLQQHSKNEEQILPQMSAQAFGTEFAAIAQRMESM